MMIGVAFYLFVYIVYYMLFKYTLNPFHIPASNRVGVSMDLGNKLSYFFSGPLPQAFTLNFLYSYRSVFSQVLYPVLFGGWVVCVFIMNKQQTIFQRFINVIVILVLLALLYLPSMIALENFASYRTLPALSLAVFILLADMLLHIFRKDIVQKRGITGLSIVLIVLGFYNYNYQLVRPLQAEYQALKLYIQKQYHPGVEKVYFIRPGKYLLANKYGI